MHGKFFFNGALKLYFPLFSFFFKHDNPQFPTSKLGRLFGFVQSFYHFIRVCSKNILSLKHCSVFLSFSLYSEEPGTKQCVTCICVNQITRKKTDEALGQFISVFQGSHTL